MKITIIGAGMMGSALAFPARENGHEVRLVGTVLDNEIIDCCIKTNRHPKFEKDFPQGVKFFFFEQMKDAIKDCDFIIGGVSSFGVDWFLNEVLAKINPKIPIITVTKGLICLDDGNLISYPDYWEMKLKEKGINRVINAIGGPCTSYELVYHDQTEVAFCGKNKDELSLIKDAMKTSYYHISLTNDIIGLESAVALKNGYALGIALTIGLCEKENGKDCGLHYNSQAGAFYQAVKEMRKLLKIQGATENCENIGIGDLYVTVYGGRTRKIGILLGEGYTFDESMEILKGVTLESIVVAKRVAKSILIKEKKGKVDIKDFPLLMHVNDVLENNKDAYLPWDSFTFTDF